MSPSPAPGNLPSSSRGATKTEPLLPSPVPPHLQRGWGERRRAVAGGPSQSLHPCRNLCVSDAVSSVLVLPPQEPCFARWLPVLYFFYQAAVRGGLLSSSPAKNPPPRWHWGSCLPVVGSAPLSPGSTSLGLIL